ATWRRRDSGRGHLVNGSDMVRPETSRSSSRTRCSREQTASCTPAAPDTADHADHGDEWTGGGRAGRTRDTPAQALGPAKYPVRLAVRLPLLGLSGPAHHRAMLADGGFTSQGESIDVGLMRLLARIWEAITSFTRPPNAATLFRRADLYRQEGRF